MEVTQLHVTQERKWRSFISHKNGSDAASCHTRTEVTQLHVTQKTEVTQLHITQERKWRSFISHKNGSDAASCHTRTEVTQLHITQERKWRSFMSHKNGSDAASCHTKKEVTQLHVTQKRKWRSFMSHKNGSDAASCHTRTEVTQLHVTQERKWRSFMSHKNGNLAVRSVRPEPQNYHYSNTYFARNTAFSFRKHDPWQTDMYRRQHLQAARQKNTGGMGCTFNWLLLWCMGVKLGLSCEGCSRTGYCRREDEGTTGGKRVVKNCRILTAHRICWGGGGGMWHLLACVKVTWREENSWMFSA